MKDFYFTHGKMTAHWRFRGEIMLIRLCLGSIVCIQSYSKINNSPKKNRHEITENTTFIIFIIAATSITSTNANTDTNTNNNINNNNN